MSRRQDGSTEAGGGDVPARPWWQSAAVYQIYPRSYQDTTGSGIGDLPGIISRLDHLRWLGVDAVWLSPIYPSPLADFGYDISDYTAIDPLYGTLEDFDRLVEEAHARDLRVIMDLVPNHTSEAHAWFQESRSSRDNPKRDWYLWRDPAPDGGPPNNWRSVFGGRNRENYGDRNSSEVLERLYLARNESLDGFDEYLATIDERDIARRRAKVESDRIAEPEPLPHFEHEWMNGGRFSSESLEGKVAVINFWGVWCGPCVREAPDIQKFAARFRDHPDVVFITVANDIDPETTRDFMEERGYDATVTIHAAAGTFRNAPAPHAPRGHDVTPCDGATCALATTRA